MRRLVLLRPTSHADFKLTHYRPVQGGGATPTTSSRAWQGAAAAWPGRDRLAAGRVIAFVTPDAHGNRALVEGLLLQADVLAHGSGDRLVRDRSIRSVQLGDLCNCVAASAADELACLAAAREWFDVVLIGNHEHPYFGGPRFAGFWRCREVGEELRKLDDERVLRPCALVDFLRGSVVYAVEAAGVEKAAPLLVPASSRASASTTTAFSSSSTASTTGQPARPGVEAVTRCQIASRG